MQVLNTRTIFRLARKILTNYNNKVISFNAIFISKE